MCSIQEDIEDLAESCKTQQNKVIKEHRNLSICKKCGEKSVLLLQKKDPFCRKCFFEYSDHKFRSTIGKNKKIKHGQKALLACSGGRKSTALLHMTKQALESASVKQISFVPGILFIDESIVIPSSAEKKEQVKEILKELKSYGYPVLYSALEMVYKLKLSGIFYWSLQDFDPYEDLPACIDSQNWFQECLTDMGLSAKLDFIKHLRYLKTYLRNPMLNSRISGLVLLNMAFGKELSLLMTEIASQDGYDYLFVGDSASSLAIDLLTDISLGRGSQISSDTNFLDSRYKVPICRPIREFLDKELAFYNYLHNCSFTVLPDLLSKTDAKSSVQRLSENFISGLQEDFPATVFTIFRTGGKLSKHNSESQAEICYICRSKLDNLQPDPCSALEALKLSQKLSQISLNDPSVSSDNVLECSETESIDIFKFLCHGCSIPFRHNTKMQSLLPLIGNMNCVQMERHKMREEIKEFIINVEETS